MLPPKQRTKLTLTTVNKLWLPPQLAVPTGNVALVLGAALVCGSRGFVAGVNQRANGFCLDVASMSRANTNQLIDEYEQDVDEIVAACDGDVRTALKALLLVSERLESALQLLSSKLADCRPYHLQLLH